MVAAGGDVDMKRPRESEMEDGMDVRACLLLPACYCLRRVEWMYLYTCLLRRVMCCGTRLMVRQG